MMHKKPLIYSLKSTKPSPPKPPTVWEKSQQLLDFYDFPAEHWKHIRTTNLIESTFATVKHRTKRSRGCLPRETAFIMVFKLIKDAEKTGRRLNGKNQLPKIISGIKFQDGYKAISADIAVA